MLKINKKKVVYFDFKIIKWKYINKLCIKKWDYQGGGAG